MAETISERVSRSWKDLPLLCPQEGIPVNNGDDHITEFGRCLQRTDMARVDRIEAAAGDHYPARGPGGIELLEGHNR
jgi:hypothetical protein